MDVLIGKPQGDKTAHLIKLSMNEKSPIITLTDQRAQYIKNRAKTIGLDIPEPIIIDRAKNEPYLFDELCRDLMDLGIKTAILDDEFMLFNCPHIIWIWMNGILLQKSVYQL